MILILKNFSLGGGQSNQPITAQKCNEYPVTSVNGQTGDVVIPNVTTSKSGLMSNTDKSKLNGIATGAQVNNVVIGDVVIVTTVKSTSEPPDIYGKGMVKAVFNTTKYGSFTLYYFLNETKTYDINTGGLYGVTLEVNRQSLRITSMTNMGSIYLYPIDIG